ncbi:MAG: hypothetical protein J2P25_13575, partial [Nocardiopsaceae bacterium]|nr:hypothetical protein [Nocardiopsaceae bacterium]
MSIWAIRGLRDGVVTTKWPKKPDEYADTWRGPVVVRPGASSRPDVPPLPSEMGANTPTPEISGFGGRLAGRSQGLEGLCPTGAIESGADGVRVDQGKCILCGRCVAERPDLFGWSEGATGPRAAALTREALVVPEAPETDEAVEA